MNTEAPPSGPTARWPECESYLECTVASLPVALLSLLEKTRLGLQSGGRQASGFRVLAPEERSPTAGDEPVSAMALRALIARGELRQRADRDARASFRYGNWLPGDEDHQRRLSEEIDRLLPGAAPSGLFWYPAGGYMGWHTNENRPGERLFCTFAAQGERSFFRYLAPGATEVTTSWDQPGWTVRRFRVGEGDLGRLWHCVYAAAEKMSFGFYQRTSSVAPTC